MKKDSLGLLLIVLSQMRLVLHQVTESKGQHVLLCIHPALTARPSRHSFSIQAEPHNSVKIQTNSENSQYQKCEKQPWGSSLICVPLFQNKSSLKMEESLLSCTDLSSAIHSKTTRKFRSHRTNKHFPYELQRNSSTKTCWRVDGVKICWEWKRKLKCTISGSIKTPTSGYLCFRAIPLLISSLKSHPY